MICGKVMLGTSVFRGVYLTGRWRSGTVWPLCFIAIIPRKGEDVLIWKLDRTGTFTVKSTLEAIQSNRRVLEEDLCIQIWEGITPKKVKVFLGRWPIKALTLWIEFKGGSLV